MLETLSRIIPKRLVLIFLNDKKFQVLEILKALPRITAKRILNYTSLIFESKI